MKYKIVFNDSLRHHGINGQKWGVRRYQNEDGSLTAAGKERYSTSKAYDDYRKAVKDFEKAERIYGRNPEKSSQKMSVALKNEKLARKNFTKQDKKQIKEDKKEAKRLQKEDKKWLRSKNLANINDKIVEEATDSLSAKQINNYKILAQSLNKVAQKYASPGKSMVLKYSEKRVKELMEDYGNLDDAYKVVSPDRFK